MHTTTIQCNDDYDGDDNDKDQVETADNFSYVDPVDGSKAAKQGIRVGEVLIKTTFNNYDFPDP